MVAPAHGLSPDPSYPGLSWNYTTGGGNGMQESRRRCHQRDPYRPPQVPWPPSQGWREGHPFSTWSTRSCSLQETETNWSPTGHLPTSLYLLSYGGTGCSACSTLGAFVLPTGTLRGHGSAPHKVHDLDLYLSGHCPGTDSGILDKLARTTSYQRHSLFITVWDISQHREKSSAEYSHQMATRADLRRSVQHPRGMWSHDAHVWV